MNDINKVVDDYDRMADELIKRYQSVSFTDVHPELFLYLPPVPATILDVGSGSGRDSNALAKMGYDVISVEPSEKMIDWAIRNNSHERISWMRDYLPELRTIKALNIKFDLIVVSAVLIHVLPSKREKAFKTLSGLLSNNGILYVSVRKGAKTDTRKFYDVSMEELNDLARENSLECLLQKENPDRFNRNDVGWTVAIYKKK